MRFYLFTSISGLIAVFIPSFIGSVRLILEGSDADVFDSNFSNQYAIVERPNYPIIASNKYETDGKREHVVFTNLQKDRLVSFMHNMDNLMQSSDARSKFFRSAPESHYTLKGLIRNLDSPLRCALYDLTTFKYVNELVDCSLLDALGFLKKRLTDFSLSEDAIFKVYTECLFFWTVELDSSSATDWEHYEMFKNGVNSGDLVAQFPIPKVMERSTSLLNRLQNFFITEVPNDEKPTNKRHLPNSSAPLLLEYNLPSNDEDNQREDKQNELMEKQRRREHFLTMYNSEKGSTETDSRRRYRRWSAEESQHGTTFEAARSNTELSRRSSTTASTRSTLSVDAQHTVIEYRRVPRKQQTQVKDEDYEQHPNNVYRGSSRASTRSTATTASGLSASPQHTVIEIRREPREPPRKQRTTEVERELPFHYEQQQNTHKKMAKEHLSISSRASTRSMSSTVTASSVAPQHTVIEERRIPMNSWNQQKPRVEERDPHGYDYPNTKEVKEAENNNKDRGIGWGFIKSTLKNIEEWANNDEDRAGPGHGRHPADVERRMSRH